MNKNFSQIITNTANEVMDTSTAFKSILKEYANKRYFQVLRGINFNCIRPDYTFDTVSGQQYYALADDFGKEISVRDSTNGLELVRCDIQRVLMDYPDSFTDTGSPARYFLTDDVVKKQPTAASVVTAVSSSASDTTVTVRIRGIVAGAETSESVTLTGTTPVVTTSQFTRIKGISKSSATVGYVTLTSNSGAVGLAIMPPKVTTSYYKLMGFHYVPSDVVTIAVPYIIKPLPLLEDEDYPVIDIADLIEVGTKADAWRYKKQFAKATPFEVEFKTMFDGYIWDMENQPNQVNQFIPVTFNRDNLY